MSDNPQPEQLPKIGRQTSAMNPNVMIYHTTVEISKKKIDRFYRPVREDSQDLKALGEVGAKLVLIQGINEVSIEPYEVHVIKAPLFPWPVIEPDVLATFKAATGVENDEQVVDLPPFGELTLPSFFSWLR